MTCMARSEWGHEPNEVASSYLHHKPQRESSESSKQTMSGKEIAAANDRSGWQVARTVTPPPLSPVVVVDVRGIALSAATASTGNITACARARHPFSTTSVNPPIIQECTNPTELGSTCTQILLGRSLAASASASGIFRVAPSHVSDNPNVDAANGAAASRSTDIDNGIERYAFLKMPALSHDTMEDSTCADDDNADAEEEDGGIVDIVCY